MVWRGDADCGFTIRLAKNDLHMIPLVHDPLLVVVPCDHPLAHADRFPAEALASEPYIKLESGTHSEMDELFRKNGVEPHVRFSLDSDYAVMSLVSAGLGYSVLPGLILRNAPFPLASLQPASPTDREIALCVRSIETASSRHARVPRRRAGLGGGSVRAGRLIKRTFAPPGRRPPAATSGSGPGSPARARQGAFPASAPSKCATSRMLPHTK